MPDQKKRTTRTTSPTTRSKRAQTETATPAADAAGQPLAAPPAPATPAPAEPETPAAAGRKTASAVKAAARRVVSSAAAPAAGKAASARKKAATTAEPASAPPVPEAAAPAPKKRTAAPRTKAPATVAPTPAPAAQAPLSILVVAAEAAPFAQTGEVGDILGRLPGALGALGHRVTLVLPKYAGCEIPGAAVDRFTVALGGDTAEAACYEVALGQNARAVLVEHAGFFDRGQVFGEGADDYADNPRRFAFLCRAALQFAAREGERIDVVVANDWPTGLVPVLLRTEFRGAPALSSASSAFVIHDVAYQGICGAEWLPILGLDASLFTVDGLEYWGQVSLLKGGVNFADVVAAVRPEYARQLISGERPSGFEGILASRQDTFGAILDGADRAATQQATDWDWAEAAPRFAAWLAGVRPPS